MVVAIRKKGFRGGLSFERDNWQWPDFTKPYLTKKKGSMRISENSGGRNVPRKLGRTK